MTPQDTLLELRGFVERERIESLTESLSTIWRNSMGSEPGDLVSDLELCRRWFDPVAQGQRLRRDLPTVPLVPDHIRDPGAPWTFAGTPQRPLITPEGRCLLDLLGSLPGTRTGCVIEDVHLLPYDRLLARLYRDWSRHRIQSVVKLLTGEEKPLQLAAGGVVIALLVNRSTSADRAIKRLSFGAARDVVDEAFFNAVNSFSRTLAPKQRPTRDQRLISGWMLYEARRRLGYDVLIVEGARPESEGRIWIEETKQDEAINVVARDLGRGHRPRVTVETLADAFDALVAAFRVEMGRLAGFGLAHERPANTNRIRDALMNSFKTHTEE